MARWRDAHLAVEMRAHYAFPMREPEISVLICTRNRADKLRLTLASIHAGRHPDAFEVIVVDNGSTDDTSAVALEFSAGLPLRLVAEPRPGLSRARNAALAAARGQLLLMTDDDCLVAPDWVEKGMSLLKADPHRLVGGRVELHDSRDLPLAIKTDVDRQQLTHVGAVWGFLHGANMAFGRSVVDRIGGFDIRFGAGSALRSAEDTDFLYRAWRANIPVTYEPELLVHHDHGRRGQDVWLKEVAQHASGFGAMAMKHAMMGDRALFQALYWDMRSTLRRCREHPSEWRRIRAKLSALSGLREFWAVRKLPDT